MCDAFLCRLPTIRSRRVSPLLRTARCSMALYPDVRFLDRGGTLQLRLLEIRVKQLRAREVLSFVWVVRRECPLTCITVLDRDSLGRRSSHRVVRCFYGSRSFGFWFRWRAGRPLGGSGSFAYLSSLGQRGPRFICGELRRLSRICLHLGFAPIWNHRETVCD